MAQFIFAKYASGRDELDVTTASSGIYAKNGTSMSNNAKLALQMLDKDAKQNTKLSKFGSTLFKQEYVDKYDLIVCMTQGHRIAIGEFDNVVLMSQISGGKDVIDPYGGSLEEYLSVAKYIEYACPDIYEKLKCIVIPNN
ncbi:MAG: hypothetical protein FWF56_05495 [Firmicutes bacterium]|nr:hypothetical protein [Bacillota bacterium]MCL1953664.1 hypothetical protein [Bacillota bacterium]